MIYITGDTHGEHERIEKAERQSGIKSGDTLIICGVFGYIFFNSDKEKAFLDALSEKSYEICFADGNHENFPAIYSYHVVDFCGGKAHEIRKNVHHLMRGNIFTIENKTFFTMGGAYSTGKFLRKARLSWWRDELPTNEEYCNASDNLKAAQHTVDYIITHTMPLCMIRRLGKIPDSHDAELTGFLEWVMYETEFKHWYCGHWHLDADLADDFTVLYYNVVKIA